MIVKICGITRARDARDARGAGADLLGFVFAPSPRRVSPEQAREIVEDAAPLPGGEGWGGGAESLHPHQPPPSRGRCGSPQIVGVFVDEKPDVVRRVVEEVGLDLVQLHGDESPDYCRSMPVPAIKAFRVRDRRSLATAVKPYLGAAGFLLFDSFRPGAMGGTGASFDWSFCEGIEDHGVPWLLAGGLTPRNVAAAVRCCRPDGVDVSGGVESGPGVKDSRLIREFIMHAKGAHGV